MIDGSDVSPPRGFDLLPGLSRSLPRAPAGIMAGLALAATLGGCDPWGVHDQPVPDFTDRMTVDRMAAKLPRRERVAFLQWALREKKVASGAIPDPTPGSTPRTVGEAIAEQQAVRARAEDRAARR